MERPLPVQTVTGKAPTPARPTQREAELEAESFMALYAQVNSG